MTHFRSRPIDDEQIKAAMTFKFPPRGPDFVAETLVTVLSAKKPMEFKAIFDQLFAELKFKGRIHGGEEMLRLRAHEKLQVFVGSGIATKIEGRYKGVPKMLKEFLKTAAEHNAKVALGLPHRSGTFPGKLAAILSKSESDKAPAKKVKQQRARMAKPELKTRTV